MKFDNVVLRQLSYMSSSVYTKLNIDLLIIKNGQLLERYTCRQYEIHLNKGHVQYLQNMFYIKEIIHKQYLGILSGPL